MLNRGASSSLQVSPTPNTHTHFTIVISAEEGGTNGSSEFYDCRRERESVSL